MLTLRLFLAALAVVAVGAVALSIYGHGKRVARTEMLQRDLETRESRDATDRAVDRVPDPADELRRSWRYD